MIQRDSINATRSVSQPDNPCSPGRGEFQEVLIRGFDAALQDPNLFLFVAVGFSTRHHICVYHGIDGLVMEHVDVDRRKHTQSTSKQPRGLETLHSPSLASIALACRHARRVLRPRVGSRSHTHFLHKMQRHV